MSTFLIERPRRPLDLSGLEEYGDVAYIFEDDDRRPSLFSTDAYIKAVMGQLRLLAFDPEKDYFVLTGPSICLALGLLAVTWYADHTSVKVLAWNAPTSSYVECIIDTKETEYESTSESSSTGTA